MSVETKGVYRAELIRVHGSRQAQANLVTQLRLEAGIDMWRWPLLSKKNTLNLMRSWRVWATTLMQLYKGEWHGGRAAKFLWEAKDVCKSYYDNPLVIAAAGAMRIDPEGHEYHMRVEMLRDQGSLALCLAELTGNPALTAEATKLFSQAVVTAENGTASRAIADMELQTTWGKRGERINWHNFSANYETVVDATLDNKNWDRLAAVSWMYARQALLAGRKKDLRDGLANLQVSCRNLHTNWLKYPLKEIAAIPLAASRRITYSTEP